jgi:hypothetical protein
VFAASNPTRLDAERIGYPKTLLNGVASEIGTERADFQYAQKDSEVMHHLRHYPPTQKH